MLSIVAHIAGPRFAGEVKWSILVISNYTRKSFDINDL